MLSKGEAVYRGNVAKYKRLLLTAVGARQQTITILLADEHRKAKLAGWNRPPS